MQHDPAIAAAHRQFLADFVGFQAEHFAHHEDARGGRRQALQAGVEDCPEVAVFESFFRISPVRRPRIALPVTIALEQRIEIGVVDFLLGCFVDRFANPSSDDVDDLVA
jgi:hypothetical protein